MLVDLKELSKSYMLENRRHPGGSCRLDRAAQDVTDDNLQTYPGRTRTSSGNGPMLGHRLPKDPEPLAIPPPCLIRTLLRCIPTIHKAGTKGRTQIKGKEATHHIVQPWRHQWVECPLRVWTTTETRVVTQRWGSRPGITHQAATILRPETITMYHVPSVTSQCLKVSEATITLALHRIRVAEAIQEGMAKSLRWDA